MAEVTKYRTMSMNISFDKEFMGGNLLGGPSTIINAYSSESAPDVVYAFIQFFFECQSMSDEFKLNAELSISYKITPKSEIKDADLYDCVESSRNSLQEIFNITFSGQRSIIQIPKIPYDVVSGNIDEQMQNLR
jgi:hypothetical protein